MATKKQKREAALAKREAFMATEKARGLEELEAYKKRLADDILQARIRAKREANTKAMHVIQMTLGENQPA